MGITQAYSVLCFYDLKNMVCGQIPDNDSPCFLSYDKNTYWLGYLEMMMV